MTTLPLTNQLRVFMTTGVDGLLPGSNAEIVVGFTDGGSIRQSLNNGNEWRPGTSKTVEVPLGRNILRSEIQSVDLFLRPAGDDCWDVNQVSVYVKGGTTHRIVEASGTPVVQLTPRQPTVRLPFSGHTVAARPQVVDLRRFQTPTKNQENRRTCITFASVAAVEAAYKRTGREIDLSEEFANWIIKSMWLAPTLLASQAENQVGAFSGGHGATCLLHMNDGQRIPPEAAMPYRKQDLGPSDHPHLAHVWNDFLFWNQRTVSDVNTDPMLFPDAARSARRYYGAVTEPVIQPKNTDELESILASQREVVVDLHAPLLYDHSVLLVGYDSRDPNHRFFYVKDSGGGWDMDDQVPYSRISAETVLAGFVKAPLTPASWDELGFVGRWNISIDGRHGILDITRVPGTMRSEVGPEHRIGTFYDDGGNAFRVNGSMTGKAIEFYIDPTDPNMAFTKLAGRKFQYTRMRTVDSQEIMSGTHTEPGASTAYGGYAKRDASLDASFALPSPLQTASYCERTFAATWGGYQGVVRLGDVIAWRDGADVIRGTFTTGTSRLEVDFCVSGNNPGKVSIAIVRSGQGQSPTSAIKLTHEPGILAGQSLVLIATG